MCVCLYLDHLLVGLGPTGVTLLDVVILPTEVFLKDDVCESDEVLTPRTFFVRAAVGFM